MKTTTTRQKASAIPKGKSLRTHQISSLKVDRGIACAPAEDRASQLADIAESGDQDNAECAAADLAREFPSHAP